jgi:hypothetical protein
MTGVRLVRRVVVVIPRGFRHPALDRFLECLATDRLEGPHLEIVLANGYFVVESDAGTQGRGHFVTGRRLSQVLHDRAAARHTQLWARRIQQLD